MENQSNQLNLTKDELADFIKSVKTLLNLQLGNSKLKSLVRDDNGMVFIFCDKNGKEFEKKLNELVIRTTDSKNNFVKNEVLTVTSSDVPSPNPGQAGGYFFSETSSDVPKFKNSKKNQNKSNSDTFSLTSPMPPKSTFMKGGNNTSSDIYSQTSPMPTNNTNNNMRGGAGCGTMSETSPMASNYKNMVLSETSPALDMAIGMNLSSMKGGKSSKKMYNQASSDIYSATSNLPTGQGQNNFRGGALTDSETINFSSDSNLDTSIFKKPSSFNNSQQKGGTVKTNSNLKNQMKDMGIGSTSTSSVCE